jgi:hypothetical protein
LHNFTTTWGIPLLIAVVIIGGGFAYLHESAQNDRAVCQAVNENRAALRNLLVSARAQSPRLTKKASRFYREQLAAITPLDCGHFNRNSLARQRAKATERAQKGGGAQPTGKKPNQPP